MAGIMVMYASMPATLSASPPVADCAVPAACGVPAGTVPMAGVTERMPVGQGVAPSGIWVPHALQKAIIPSVLCLISQSGEQRSAICRYLNAAESYQNNGFKANGIRSLQITEGMGCLCQVRLF